MFNFQEDENNHDSHEDCDKIELNSDLVITFKNTKCELLDKYPNGFSLCDTLKDVDGSEWTISLYPNGYNSKTKNKLSLGLKLTQLCSKVDANSCDTCDAECIYQVINLDRQKTYSTNISRRLFRLDAAEYDSTFSSAILNEDESNFVVQIEIIQFKSNNDASKVDLGNTSTVHSVVLPNKHKYSNLRYISESLLKLLNLKKN